MQSGTSELGTSTILLLSKKVFGKLCSKVSQIVLSYSFTQTVSKPAL
jgi:hypothetical protein